METFAEKAMNGRKFDKVFKETYSHPVCNGHIPAPQRFMSSDIVVRVCAKCGRQYEPATGITHQK